MKRYYYKVKVPFEIIVRGNKFIEYHPGIKIEDYLRALVVIYSKGLLDSLDINAGDDELFGKEVEFSFNLNMNNSLNNILKEHGVSADQYIRMACIQIDKALVLDNPSLVRDINLVLVSP